MVVIRSTFNILCFPDINDNAPTFEQSNTIGYVSENEQPGTVIMTLSATDRDLPPNGAPFTYQLIGGAHRSFVAIETHSGLVKTTRSIDRESTSKLELIVQVEDNGTPKLRSQHTIVVNVLDQNDTPSMPRTVHVLLHVFNQKIPVGKIADIHPNDLDIIGDYKCKITKDSNPAGVFTIPSGCDLYASPAIPIQGYSFSVLGNDGKHSDVVSTVSVEFLAFDNRTVENSVTIKLYNMTAVQFVSDYYRNFVDVIKSAIDSNDIISLYSLHDTNSSLDIEIAVRMASTGAYRSTSFLAERFNKKRHALLQLLQISNLTIGYSPCDQHACENGGVCSQRINVDGEIRIADSPSLIFTSPSVSHDFKCSCANGYTGTKCDKRQDPCAPNPCQAGGYCRRQGYDFQCQCPSHREGKLCQLEKGDVCSSMPCKNGGSCRGSPDGSSFCLCRPGFRGNECETISDSCRPNPCLNGGLCVGSKPGYNQYICSCVNGHYGRHCERSTFSFHELSYMSFPALDAATNDISIVFATTKPNALLIYNYGTQSGGRSDFVAIEIVKTKAVFSFGGARTAITSVETGGADGTLSNGKWHKVTATRNGRTMSLSVSRCSDNGDDCEECRPGDASCYSDDVGPTG